MPEDIQTWETASAPPPVPDAPAPEPVIEATPDPAPPAETPTLEKPEAAPLEAEPAAARESESETVTPEPAKEEPKDDYVAEADDPPEITALTTASAKKWAKRQFKDAEPVRKFQDFSESISTFVDDLNQRSPSRFKELLQDVATGFPDQVSRHLFGMSHAELKQKLETLNAPEAATEDPEMPGELPATDAEARLAAEKQQLAEANRSLQTQLDDFKKQLEAVTGEIAKTKSEGFQQTVVENQTKLYNNVWSVVDEGIRNLGLEPQPNDPPKLAHLKKVATDLLSRDRVEPVFDASEDNTKLVKHVYEATQRGEFQNAFREEDNLKVRLRAAFQTRVSAPEVQAIISEIENLANQSKATTRGADPIPPAPGSSLGVTIKPPTTWDEAVAQSAP